MLQPTPDRPVRVRRGESSTKVCFPRFEYEHAITGEKRPRAQAREWLTADEVRLLLSPDTVVAERQRLNLKGRWWGVYHHAKERTTQGEVYTGVDVTGGAAYVYRCRILGHEYLWDEQAVSGNAVEVVLERQEDDRFVDVAALMVRGSIYQDQDLSRQQLVDCLGAGADEWWDSRGALAEGHLAIMLDLCHPGATESTLAAARVDNRGAYL